MTGNRGIVFNPSHDLRLREGLGFQVPCGRCVGCRIDRTRDWAVRCSHEAQLYGVNNAFLTLTYDDKHLPADFSVSVRTHQLFMKRLRKFAGKNIRFFACGEYGADDLNPFEGNRPHYHYCIFNYQFSDLKLFKKNQSNNNIYTSNHLQNLWPYGFSTVGTLSYASAAYTARYITKKIGGDLADDHYTRVHPVTGTMCRVLPEFSKQSNRPGIGDAWYETFKNDIYPSDFCVVEGKRHPVPKYYVKKLAEEERHELKLKRKVQSRLHKEDSTPARLKVREAVKLAQINLLKRELK